MNRKVSETLAHTLDFLLFFPCPRLANLLLRNHFWQVWAEPTYTPFVAMQQLQGGVLVMRIDRGDDHRMLTQRCFNG